MTNWHDPILLIAEARSFSSLLNNYYDSSSPDSCLHQASPCRRWRVLVSSLVRSLYANPSSDSHGVSPHSWEFVLNFDYEYSVITGKRRFNRTVPACSSLLVSMILEIFIPQAVSSVSYVVGPRLSH
jgi:hypothetical protein